MKSRTAFWKPVRRPLALVCRKGWQWGRRALISPRGTVFVVHFTSNGIVARKRTDFVLNEE